MFFTFKHDHDTDQDLLTVVGLAAVQNIGDSSMASTGGQLQQAVRYLEVGGLVYSMVAAPSWQGTSSPPEGGTPGILD